MFKILSRVQAHKQAYEKLLSLETIAGAANATTVRYKSGTPFNTVILFVPQQEAWIIERFGRYHRLLQPGLNFILPIIDSIKYVQSLKELAIDIPHQSAITIGMHDEKPLPIAGTKGSLGEDNVILQIDGVLYLRVADPYKASYGVEDAEYAITQLAQTTMRSEIGKMQLDAVFRERDNLNVAIVHAINKASQAWGIQCLRYEIRDIKVPERIQDAMQMQVEAERKKRAVILQSEGVRTSDINLAEGKKLARILQSEAVKTEQINNAIGEAQAVINKAQARARSIDLVANSLQQRNAMNAVSMNVAEHYIAAFSNLAKQNNTVLLPTNTGDISSMVTQAMTIYKSISDSSQGGTQPNPTPSTKFTPEIFPEEADSPTPEKVQSPTASGLEELQEQMADTQQPSLELPQDPHRNV